MKNLFFIPVLAFVVVFTTQLNAQVALEYLDVNNVKATILTHGDMFWNPATAARGYEFPKGSGKFSNFANSLWIAGFDSANNLHVSAQTYRQGGNDYWPGPLDSSGSLTMTTSNNWDKVWKVNQSAIDSFLSASPHTLANTPQVILEWPAKGNIYAKGKAGASLSINKNMAPFVDVNMDGIYDPLAGDYPKIKGEQTLWWVFSDNGPTHDETNGLPFKVEIKAMAYACNSIPALQNTTYYSFNILNYNSSVYTNTRIGIWSDIDLGYAFDDYIGIDTNRRMGVAYNADIDDDGIYGTQLTQTGTVLIKSPMDGPSYKHPVGSYMYYDNIASPTGNPITAKHYAQYLNSLWLDSLHLTKTCNGRIAGPSANLIFPDDPSGPGSLSEVACGNPPNDRRFIMTTSDFMLPTLDPIELTFAVVNTPTGSNNCCFTTLQALADSAIAYPDACKKIAFPASIDNHIKKKDITLYPNPVSDQVTISWQAGLKNEITSIRLVNMLGELIMMKEVKHVNSTELDLKNIANGVYHVQLFTTNQMLTKKLLKQ